MGNLCGGRPSDDPLPPAAPCPPGGHSTSTRPTDIQMVVVGDAGVGKTCVRKSFDGTESFAKYEATEFDHTSAPLAPPPFQLQPGSCIAAEAASSCSLASGR